MCAPTLLTDGTAYMHTHVYLSPLFVYVSFQAYAYGGAGIIINCLTDNTNRAKTEINNVIKKTDVKLASSGSVAFNFDRKVRGGRGVGIHALVWVWVWACVSPFSLP